jgi:hypothetical protein
MGRFSPPEKALAKKGWIGVETQGQRRHQFVTVTVLDRWQETCPGHDSAYGQNSSNAEPYAQKLSIDNLKTALKTEDIFQQRAREDEDDSDRAMPLPHLLTRVPDDSEDESLVRSAEASASTLAR